MVKKVLLGFALLATVSVWADDVWNYNVYGDCSKNGYKGGYIAAPADVQAVDLGLPSGTKWASCNIGAEKPEDYGYYYAWGEVLLKERYKWENYKYANGSKSSLIKYCINNGDNGFTDNKTTLDVDDDAVCLNWSGNWRMPTKVEWYELLNNCIWAWTKQNGSSGYRVTSKSNGNFIFLPAAGKKGTENDNVGLSGEYWSSSLGGGESYNSWRLYFDSNSTYGSASSRYQGRSVRPVYSSFSTAQSASYVFLTLYAEGCENANVIGCNVGQQVNVSAVPQDEHNYFVRWSDGNTDNPRLVTVSQNMVLTAEFASDPSLTLISADESMGTVSGAGQFKANSLCKISAKAKELYCFTQWSDGNTDNPRTIVLTCDTTFTAEFALAYSGQCGDKLFWNYAGHTLTITGTGDMYDYRVQSYYDENRNYGTYITTPWRLFSDTIDAVVLEQGITHIGSNAFNGLAKLNKIELPSTLTSIGESAFAGCRKLYDIYAYPTEPPVADNTSFANFNVNLYVPCDNLRDYQMDAVFGSFKYIQCISSTDTEQIQADTIRHAAQKVLRNGQVYILRNGKTYTLTGGEVK